MQKLSFLVLLLLINIVHAQSPHGENFNIDCEECHSTEKWDIDYKKIDFNHSVTSFELVGQHKTLDCRNCHATIKFSEIKNSCQDCHTDIHQNSVGLNCGNCHTSESWLVQNTNELHMMSRFPLEGAHKKANCIDCHTSSNNLVFEPLGVNCIDCHQPDYLVAKFPDHVVAGFSTDCQECHQITDLEWSRAKVTHDFFLLTSGHNISNCFDCHTQNSFEGLTQDCYSCHQSDFNSVLEPNHVVNNFGANCENCHTTNPNWRPALFKDHDDIFQLVGAHKIIENDCSRCHNSGYSNTPNQCYDCHKSNYENTINPSHTSAGFGTDCESCHNSNAWQPANFDHDNQFFPISSGEHNNEWNSCSDCHTNSSNYQVFSCITCHEHNQNEMNSEHSDINGYTYESTACLACHPSGEGEGGFNHSATNFPLTGAHVSNECSDCHSSGYQGTSTICSDCHTNEYQNSTNPNHQQIGLELECEQCHTTIPDWQPATFDVHNDYFVIEGAHNTIKNDCATCHNNDYNNTGNQCIDCHSNNYNSATDPNHETTGFGTDCETCHTQTAWEPAEFDHDNQFFPIYSGKHNNQWNDCAECHVSASNFQVFSCIDCHEHNKTDTDDDHSKVQGYQYTSNECFVCHPVGTSDGAFNHSTTAFPLTGQHSLQECSDCHQSGYTNTANDCASCHQNSFDSSIDPNHTNAGISIECEQCHTSLAWKPSTFNHVTTGFELSSGHNLSQCSDCHKGNTVATTSNCYSCHQTNYESALEHVSQGYPKTCEDCHNNNNWEEANFNHSNTNFALTGAHNSVNCSDCHTSGYSGTSTDCSDCHNPDYNTSTNPNHTSLGLSTNCEDCHSTNPNWKPASFSVHNNFYVLQGAHANILNDCSTCHNDNYSNTPNTCYQCHTNEYNVTTNPPHQSSGFGTDCEECHTQNVWEPSTFDHDAQYFPINSGAHREKWNNCSDCHTNQNNFSQFSCLNCHEHNQSKMDDKHKEENGYVYESNACYSCHPNGRSERGFKRFIEEVR